MKRFWFVFCTLNLLLFFTTSALADLVLAEGGPTGQWRNVDRSGEGFYVEIIDNGDVKQIGVAMYSFNADGDQLWIVGTKGLEPDDEVAPVTMAIHDGPVWGPGFDTGDLNSAVFGTLTVRFPTCDTALFKMAVEPAMGLQGGNYSLTRLTSIKGVECKNPPPEQSFPSGRWDGDGICFNVAEDGQSITSLGSSCANGAAFAANLFGVSEDTGDCDVDFECLAAWTIDEEGNFGCTNSDGDLATGHFDSANSASGFAFKEKGGNNDYCVSSWIATP